MLLRASYHIIFLPRYFGLRSVRNPAIIKLRFTSELEQLRVTTLFTYFHFPHFHTMTWLSVAASVGMAVGPPLVYADQAISIIRKKYAS